MLRKFIFLFLDIALVASLSSCRPEGVSFPDSNLEAVIRKAIAKPKGPILISDLERITRLSCKARGITEVKGVEHCINLTELDLSGNSISDILRIASLTKLTHLNLRANPISDISPLASLTNLTELDLSLTEISDILRIASSN